MILVVTVACFSIGAFAFVISGAVQQDRVAKAACLVSGLAMLAAAFVIVAVATDRANEKRCNDGGGTVIHKSLLLHTCVEGPARPVVLS